jgi:type IV pilus assembly protein PilB
MSDYQRLGEMLVAKGVLTHAQLQHVLDVRSRSSSRFGEIVVQLGFVTDADVAACLAEQYDLPLVDPATLDLEPRAIKLIPAIFALRRSVLPVQVSTTELVCAVSDPIDVNTSDEISIAVGKKIRLLVAPEAALQEAIAKAYALPIAAMAAPPKPKRKRKVDPQQDRVALLATLQDRMSMRSAA